jgi:hypothetical protein
MTPFGYAYPPSLGAEAEDHIALLNSYSITIHAVFEMV